VSRPILRAEESEDSKGDSKASCCTSPHFRTLTCSARAWKSACELDCLAAFRCCLLHPGAPSSEIRSQTLYPTELWARSRKVGYLAAHRCGRKARRVHAVSTRPASLSAPARFDEAVRRCERGPLGTFGRDVVSRMHCRGAVSADAGCDDIRDACRCEVRDGAASCVMKDEPAGLAADREAGRLASASPLRSQLADRPSLDVEQEAPRPSCLPQLLNDRLGAPFHWNDVLVSILHFASVPHQRPHLPVLDPHIV